MRIGVPFHQKMFKKELSPIEARVKAHEPRSREGGGRLRSLTDDDRILVIWGWSNGWTGAEIARKIPCNKITVYNFKRAALDDLRLIFDLPLLLQLEPRKFECQMCMEVRNTRIKCMRHVLSHFLPIEMAKTAPVEGIEFL